MSDFLDLGPVQDHTAYDSNFISSLLLAEDASFMSMQVCLLASIGVKGEN